MSRTEKAIKDISLTRNLLTGLSDNFVNWVFASGQLWSAWCSVLTDHSQSQEIDNEPDKYRIFRPLVPALAV